MKGPEAPAGPQKLGPRPRLRRRSILLRIGSALRPGRRAGRALLAAAGIALLGAGGYFIANGARTRTLSLCVETDFEYRAQRPNWEASLKPLIDEVDRLFGQTGVQWQLVRGGESYPPQDNADLRQRADLLQQSPSVCKADVVLGLTGYVDRSADAVAPPFSHVALVTDSASNGELMSATIVARTLGKLFGVPGAIHAVIINNGPGGSAFDEQALNLIRAMRDYDFAQGIGALHGRWERRAAAALTDALAGKVPHPQAEAHRVLGQAFSQNRKYDDAARQMRQAVALAPGDGRLRLELAMDLEQAADSQLAVQELKTIERLDPEDARPHAVIGAIYLNAQRVDEAIDELRTATRLDPRNSGYATAYGIALARQPGRLHEASAAFSTAFKLRPTEQGALAGLEAQDESERELKTEAARLAEEVRKNPTSADAHLKLGLAYGFSGDLNAAQREVQRAIDLQPGDGSAHLTMARLLYLKGDYGAAEQSLKAAVAAGATPRREFENNLKRRLNQPAN